MRHVMSAKRIGLVKDKVKVAKKKKNSAAKARSFLGLLN